MSKVSETRMVDIQPDALYEDLQNVAAQDWIADDGTRSGASEDEKLALRQAFTVGADTSTQFDGHFLHIVGAVLAGRKWGLQEQSTTRLVLTGKIRSGFSTMEMTIDSTSDDSVAAAGLPLWNPQHPPEAAEPDHDLKRKQEIEDAMADGTDL